MGRYVLAMKDGYRSCSDLLAEVRQAAIHHCNITKDTNHEMVYGRVCHGWSYEGGCWRSYIMSGHDKIIGTIYDIWMQKDGKSIRTDPVMV